MRHARINYIGEVPDGSGRQYVPDLNGPLYLLDRRPAAASTSTSRPSSPTSSPVAAWAAASGSSPSTRSSRRTASSTPSHTEQFARLGTKPTTYPAQRNTFLHGVVTEWTATDPSRTRSSGTHREILRLGFATQIHGIQQIDFNPTAEPGGRGLRPAVRRRRRRRHRARTPTSRRSWTNPYGKILRIDPDGTDGPNGQYGVPTSNPFVGEDGAVGEIYALGMRDPHRFSWDPGGQHRMFLGPHRPARDRGGLRGPRR